MKKYLLLMLLAFPIAFMGCSSDDDGEENKNNNNGGETIKVSLTVSDIAANQATINAALTEGTFHGAMLVEAVNSNTVTINYTSEVQLINYVKENGVEIDLPYSNTITGLKDNVEMFSAVIVFDSNGTAVNSDYKLWTAIGEATGFSDDNNAGELDESIWGEDSGDSGSGGDEPEPEPEPEPGTGSEVSSDGGAGNLGGKEW